MKSWNEVAIPAGDFAFVFPSLQLTNSASGTKDSLAHKPLYRMYVCGITPYDATHLGHAATYLTFDLINRYLRATGAEVLYVQNITDVDDPLLERANRDGVDWSHLAHQQIDLFKADMVDLRVIPPAHYIGAVEAIPLVVNAIAELQEQSSIYSVNTDYYFSVKSDSKFGFRSNLSQQHMLDIFSQRGGDPDRVGKQDPLDCLVWMSQRVNEPGWDSSLGKGRPGWHIECTAIALRNLPKASSTSITLQAGGNDLMFPHHYMTALQARALTGVEFASCYCHAGMIGLDGEKMSKSRGNLVFVSKLRQEGVSPALIRIALFSGRYCADRMWSRELIEDAGKILARLISALSRQEVAPTFEVVQEIVNAISDDLNTPKVFDLLNTWCLKSEEGKVGGSPGEISRALDTYLGITL